MIITADIIYIVILLLTVLLLAVIVLISLFLRSEARYTKLRTAGQSESDITVIDTARKISAEILKKAENQALKIVESSKNINNNYDIIVDKTINQIISSWSVKSDRILETELKKLIQDIAKKDQKILEEYKNQKISELELKIDEFVKKVGKKIIARDITLSEHKEFISQALEEAYKNGQFN